jgi:hypothetical protein
MRDMTDKEKEEYYAGKKAERSQLRQQITELNQKRAAFIKTKLAEGGDTDSFDAQVLSMIRAQAVGKGITY